MSGLALNRRAGASYLWHGRRTGRQVGCRRAAGSPIRCGGQSLVGAHGRPLAIHPVRADHEAPVLGFRLAVPQGCEDRAKGGIEDLEQLRAGLDLRVYQCCSAIAGLHG